MTNNEEMKELLPCPMCGGTAHVTKGYAMENVWPHGEFHRVFCGCCQLRQLFHKTEAEAIAAWNCRAQVAGWQPIATAPKDGTPILVSDGKTAAAVYWWPYVWMGTTHNGMPNPTHWQPLPAAPRSEG